MKNLLLIDGNSMLFKAYYATAYSGKLLKAIDGTPTNAIYAFANMLNKYLTEHQYSSVVVCFDKGKKTFRNDLLSTYKAQRSSTPNDLIIQFKIARELLSAMGIIYLEQDNYEADDLIGCLTYKAINEGYKVDIMSSDKDLYQLISENVNIIVTKQGVSNIERFDLEKLNEKWGIAPNQIPDLKGLMGDPSDNIKGIPNVGEKTALKLLHQYYDIENLFLHADELPAKLSTNIKTHIDEARLSKTVATIICDLDLNHIKFEPLAIDLIKLKEFYYKYNMNSLVAKIQDLFQIQDGEIVRTNYEDAINPKIVQVNDWNNFVLDDINSVYLEVFNENYHLSPIIGLSWNNKKGTFYQSFENLQSDPITCEFLNNKNYKKITFDVKKTLCALARYNINFTGVGFDAMLAGYILNLTEIHSLSSYADFLLGINFISDDLFFNKGVKRSIPADETKVSNFIGAKAKLIMELHQPMLEKLQLDDQIFLLNKIELPCALALAMIENNGVCVDLKELSNQTQRIFTVLDQLRVSIQSYGDTNFNPNSPKQLQEILFNKLKLKDTGRGSTSQANLEKLLGDHPIIDLILDYRRYQKLFSTYLNGMQKYLFPDGKVHTIYNQTLTTTGRLSSIEPNMQNISVHDPVQKEVRKIFVPTTSDYTLMSADYSQIELRVLAHMSQDDSMLRAFAESVDIHNNTAMKIFKVASDLVDDNMRRRAKAVNFGIIYGISDYGLSKQLKIRVNEAKIIIDNYFAEFPTIRDFINKQISFCKTNGYAKTIFNRRRLVPEINDRNYLTNEFGKRIAMNMPIQGTAADIIKIALNELSQAFVERNLKSKVIAQIHDELIFEVLKLEQDEVSQLVKTIMETCVKLIVPLKVDIKFGNNWYEIK